MLDIFPKRIKFSRTRHVKKPEMYQPHTSHPIKEKGSGQQTEKLKRIAIKARKF